jgi:hypothetical protein
MPELTYKQLQAAVADAQKRITRSAEAINAKARQINEEARDTGRVAEQIGAMRVDSATVSETRELSKIMAGVSEAAIAYAAAGDTTARAAQAAHAQNHASHDRINEAVNRSPVGREIYDVFSDWCGME